MNDVFLDTVGLLAVWSKQDQWHSAAEMVYQDLQQNARRLLTTPLVLWEIGNAAARRPFRSYVNPLRQKLMQEGLLIEPTHQDIEDALIDAVEVPAEACSVSVSLDRVSVPMEEPRRRPVGRPRLRR